MFRRSGYNGRSKAAPDTLCQKCLKRGHYSYECKTSAQERPYKSRPSRTQQLLNPQLKPKLTTEVPNDLLRKKGVADEILAKKDEERGGKRRRGSSRSTSPFSDDSVSTISSNRSPSRSRSRSRSVRRIEEGKPSMRGGNGLKKRTRRSVSSASESSPDRLERSTRRRMSSFSPAERGRPRTRSRSSRMDLSPEHKPRRKARRHRSRSRSNMSYGARRPKSKSPPRSPNVMDTSEDHVPPSRHQRESPRPRQRWAASPGRRGPSRSPSRSPYRSRSPKPYTNRRAPRSPSPRQGRNGGGTRPHENHHYRTGGGHHTVEQPSRFDAKYAPPPVQAAPPRERSLSPFSKRVALTKQLNAGR